MALKKIPLFHARFAEMTTTYTFKFPDGKTVKNPVTGLTHNVEDIISEAAEKHGGSSAGKKTNRGIRTMKVCFTGKNEKNRVMFDMECAVYKPDIHVT
jgi:hypothetical protein